MHRPTFLAAFGLFLLLLPPGGAAFAQGGLAPLEPPVAPEGNLSSPAKVNLGKAIFWDERLSSTNTVACGTCHLPAGGSSDPRSLANPSATHPGPDATFGTADDLQGSLGVPQHDSTGRYESELNFGIVPQVTGRRSRSVTEALYADSLFWDGRAGDSLVDPDSGETVLATGAALESQVLGPPLSSVEMGHLDRDWASVTTRLAETEPLSLANDLPIELADWLGNRDYPALFEEAFGTPEITATRIAMAVATYERELVPNQTPFDATLAGGPPLTAVEAQGRAVFVQRGCNLCHAGTLMSDDNFHYIGVRPVNDDLARFAVTGNAPDRGAVRTPSLRNVALRAPYMHTGTLATLADVVDFYNRGGDFNAPNKPPIIAPLGLTDAERTALIAFLGRPLTDPRLVTASPPFDRPNLYSEGDLVPQLDDVGVVGSSGELQVVALEPAYLGNPAWTVGVWHALGGATATFALDSEDPGLTLPTQADFALTTITLAGSALDDGWGSVTLPIPPDTSPNSELFGRWYVEDNAAPGGHAVSQRLRVRPFPTRRGPGSTIFADNLESGDTGAWSSQEP